MKVLATILSIFLVGCAGQVKKVDWSAFQDANPRSILVVPVVNNSLDVDASNYMLSTLSIPLAEKGYYVFPVNTVKHLLQSEGFYEPSTIHDADPAALAEIFGADSILYVTIQRWDAQYLVISTSVTVDFDYLMLDSEGNKIWEAHKTMVYTPQNNNSGGGGLATLISMAINAAITKAVPNYMPLAHQANNQVMVLEATALPAGPYNIVD